MAAIIGLGLLIAFGWGFLNPFVGLMGLLAINIIQPGELYPIFNTLHVERLSAIIVLISLLLNKGRFSIKGPMSRQVLFFWFALFASVPLAYWRGGALHGAMEFYQIAVYFFLVINLVDTTRRLHTLIIVYVALTGWLAVSSYWAYSHGDYYVSSTFGRAEGLTSSGGDPNSLGITLVSALPWAGLLLFRGNKLLRLLGFGVIAASVITLVLTGSRTAFLGFIALTLVFGVTRRKKVFILPFAVLIVLGVFYLAPSENQQRYLSVEQRDEDLSYTNRVLAWHAGWAMMKHNPLTGIGATDFAVADGGKYWPGPEPKLWLQPHSLYIQVGAELGIIGVVAFGWLLLSTFRLNQEVNQFGKSSPICPRWLQNFATASNFSLFVLLFTGYAAHSLYRSTWFLLAAMSACAYSFREHPLLIGSPERSTFTVPANRSWAAAPSMFSR